jgi:hypothetical protein
MEHGARKVVKDDTMQIKWISLFWLNKLKMGRNAG